MNDEKQSLVEAFNGNVILEKKPYGYEASCKLGLWSVSGRDKEQVINEAMSYLAKYYMDGEYE